MTVNCSEVISSIPACPCPLTGHGWPIRSSNLAGYADLHSLRFADAVLLLPVADRGADGVLGKYGAMNLDRRQRELLYDVGVLDLHRFVDCLALYPLGGERRRRNGRTAAEGLELRLFDHLRLGIDPDLQTHHVAALWSAHQASANFAAGLVELAYVTRIVVVVDDLVAVCHVILSCISKKPIRQISAVKLFL